MTPLELRADVPALQEADYFNYGAHGPSPRYVVEAADEFVRSHEYETPMVEDPYDVAYEAFDPHAAAEPAIAQFPTGHLALLDADER